MIFYFAHPIDQYIDREAPEELRAAIADAQEAMRSLGITWYEPYSFGMADRSPKAVYRINQYALHTSDAVIAVWPEDASSVGVPMEVLSAFQAGIPVAVVGGKRSMQFAALEIACFDHPSDGVRYLARELMRRKLSDQDAPDQPSRAEPSQLLYPLTEINWTGDGKPPTKKYLGDAGWDLYVQATVTVFPGETIDVPHGVKVQLPEGYWGLITGRSSTIRKRGLLVTNGIIDNDYRGELFAAVTNVGRHSQEINAGERIAQLIPFRQELRDSSWTHVDKLDPSERGEAGFGSTGV